MTTSHLKTGRVNKAPVELKSHLILSWLQYWSHHLKPLAYCSSIYKCKTTNLYRNLRQILCTCRAGLEVNPTTVFLVDQIHVHTTKTSHSSRYTVRSLRKKATINQVTTMLASSKNVPFPGHNHLITTGTDDPSL